MPREDAKPMMKRDVPKSLGLDPDAGRERAEMFARITQGRGKQQRFGTGDPKNVPKPKPPKGEKP